MRKLKFKIMKVLVVEEKMEGKGDWEDWERNERCLREDGSKVRGLTRQLSLWLFYNQVV